MGDCIASLAGIADSLVGAQPAESNAVAITGKTPAIGRVQSIDDATNDARALVVRLRTEINRLRVL